MDYTILRRKYEDRNKSRFLCFDNRERITVEDEHDIIEGMPDKELNHIRENAMARVNKEFNLEKQSQEFHSFFN